MKVLKNEIKEIIKSEYVNCVFSDFTEKEDTLTVFKYFRIKNQDMYREIHYYNILSVENDLYDLKLTASSQSWLAIEE